MESANHYKDVFNKIKPGNNDHARARLAAITKLISLGFNNTEKLCSYTGATPETIRSFLSRAVERSMICRIKNDTKGSYRVYMTSIDCPLIPDKSKYAQSIGFFGGTE